MAMFEPESLGGHVLSTLFKLLLKDFKDGSDGIKLKKSCTMYNYCSE